jgi:hypothetical protein
MRIHSENGILKIVLEQFGREMYFTKVVEFGQQKWAEKMKVVWYWPSMRAGAQTESGCSRTRYTNCTWKHLGSHHLRDMVGLSRKQQYSPRRMCQQEQEAGLYMRTMYRCMV